MATQERTVRPYQLLCSICALGRGDLASESPEIQKLLNAIRQDPDLPVTLACNVGEVFGYQDPGLNDDTPEGADFYLKRDLEILYQLNLFPGARLPARILFHRVWEQIDDLAGICTFPSVTATAWAGCPCAVSDDYAKGREKGIEALIPPRCDTKMCAEKVASMIEVAQAEIVSVRPHILVCSVCQYGSGLRPPYAEDNLPEQLQRILAQPDLRIRLVPHADWMMCAPCPSREPGRRCITNRGSGGLPNQMRDLRVLQILGLTFGSVMAGGALYRRLLDRIRGTWQLCHIDHGSPSVWFTGCGTAETDSESYRQGREQLLTELE